MLIIIDLMGQQSLDIFFFFNLKLRLGCVFYVNFNENKVNTGFMFVNNYFLINFNLTKNTFSSIIQGA